MTVFESLTEVSASHKIATIRLRKAVCALASEIADAIEAADLTKAGEFVVWNQHWRGQTYGTRWIAWRGVCLNGSGGLFAGDFNCPCPDRPKSGEILAFAAAVAKGELDKLREAIAAAVKPLNRASETLEEAEEFVAGAD